MKPKEILEIGIKQGSYPQYLMKYRGDNDKTEQILSNNELWFSNPLLFNDPYDCNTPFNSSTSIDKIKEWLRRVGVANSDIENYARKLQENPNYMEEATKRAINKLRICCFSTLENNLIQWSHYSDYHKGLCLVYDIQKDTDFFTIPQIVCYRDIMQRYNHFVHKGKIVEYLIKPKYSGWSYESEVRIVKSKPPDSKDEKGDLFPYDPLALKEIIFGVHTPKSVIDKYMKLCDKTGKKHIVFSKMRLGNGIHYELCKELM